MDVTTAVPRSSTIIGLRTANLMAAFRHSTSTQQTNQWTNGGESIRKPLKQRRPPRQPPGDQGSNNGGGLNRLDNVKVASADSLFAAGVLFLIESTKEPMREYQRKSTQDIQALKGIQLDLYDDRQRLVFDPDKLDFQSPLRNAARRRGPRRKSLFTRLLRLELTINDLTAADLTSAQDEFPSLNFTQLIFLLVAAQASGRARNSASPMTVDSPNSAHVAFRTTLESHVCERLVGHLLHRSRSHLSDDSALAEVWHERKRLGRELIIFLGFLVLVATTRKQGPRPYLDLPVWWRLYIPRRMNSPGKPQEAKKPPARLPFLLLTVPVGSTENFLVRARHQLRPPRSRRAMPPPSDKTNNRPWVEQIERDRRESLINLFVRLPDFRLALKRPADGGSTYIYLPQQKLPHHRVPASDDGQQVWDIIEYKAWAPNLNLPPGVADCANSCISELRNRLVERRKSMDLASGIPQEVIAPLPPTEKQPDNRTLHNRRLPFDTCCSAVCLSTTSTNSIHDDHHS